MSLLYIYHDIIDIYVSLSLAKQYSHLEILVTT